MRCDQVREALSARLDSEDEPIPAADTDRHLQTCVACRIWLRDATAVTRAVRVQPVDAVSRLDVTALVRAARPRPSRLAVALRTALGALGAAQLLLGIAQVLRNASEADAHGASLAAGASAGHLWHESAAWNVAVGAGFAWIAWRRARPAGALPMLTAFVALLVLLNATDVFAGHVEQLHLLGHGILLAGYAIVITLCHPRLDPGAPPGGRGRWWRRPALDADPASPTAAPPLRLVRGEGTAHVSERIAA